MKSLKPLKEVFCSTLCPSTQWQCHTIYICPICNNVLWICIFIKITIFNCSAPPPCDISHNKGRRACLSLLRRLDLADANANEKPMKRKEPIFAGTHFIFTPFISIWRVVESFQSLIVHIISLEYFTPLCSGICICIPISFLVCN